MTIVYRRYKIEINKREYGDFVGCCVGLSHNIYGFSYGEILDQLTPIIDEYWTFEEFRSERGMKLNDWF